MDLKVVVIDIRRLLTAAAGLFLVLAATTGVGYMFSDTGDRLGIRRFVTPEITPAWRIAERFRMNTDGLRAITIRPAVVGAPEGRVRFELRSVTPEATWVFRSAEVP